MIGVIIGYIVYAIPRGAGGGVTFGYWVSRPLKYAGLWWAMTGAIIGAAVIYVKRITS